MTDFDKGRILQCIEQNMSQRATAKLLGFARMTVKNFIDRYYERGSIDRQTGSGRKRKTSPVEDRHLAIFVKKHRTATIEEIQECCMLKNVSVSTISRRITEMTGMNSHFTVKKFFVSEKNRKIRLKWARDHKDWTVEHWRKVLWSDESPFTLRYQCRHRVWRLPEERFERFAIKGTVKHDKKINIWGCFCASGVGKLYLVDGILEKKQFHRILRNQLFPSASHLFPDGDWIFQQDNDPKHTAKSNQKYLQNKKVDVMKWPSQSPDLNPIENLWGYLNYCVKDRTPQNEEQLFEIIECAWNKLPTDYLRKLVDSMPRRCAAVIAANGCQTKY